MTKAGGFRWGRPRSSTLAAMLAAAERVGFTYDHLGSSITDGSESELSRARVDAVNAGRVFRQVEVLLGSDAESFDSARTSLRHWACHRGINAAIYPELAPINEGQTVLVCLPAGPGMIVVPNRIVTVVDEANRFGFAYGTLEGHQERGEESFIVEQQSDGSVLGRIAVDSCPGSLITRAAGPAAVLLQRVAIRRYLGSLREDVARRSTSRGE